jgi:hypothetical protein
LQRRAIARRSDQDGRRAGLPGNNGKPNGSAETHRRRGNFGKTRGVGCPRHLLRKNADCGMQRRAARTWAEGTIFMVARRGAVAVMGAGMGAMKCAGYACLTGIEARGREAGASGDSVGNHGMRGRTWRGPVLCGHAYLGEAGNENEPKADGLPPAARGATRKLPTTLEPSCPHLLHLRNGSWRCILYWRKWTRLWHRVKQQSLMVRVSPSETPRLSGTVTLGQQGKGGKPSLPVQRVSLT